MNSDYRRNDPPRSGYGGPGTGRDGYGAPTRRGVPLSDLDPVLTEVSRKVIGCAIEVHRNLGPGYSKDVYSTALRQELDTAGVRCKVGHAVNVNYKGTTVGSAVADLFIDDRFLVDVMADQREVGSQERTVMRAHLRAADLELGLIINFGERRLKDGLVRVLNPLKIASLRGEDHDDVHDPAGFEGDAGRSA